MSYEQYYRNPKIQFELVKQFKYKEISFIQKAPHPTYTQFAIRQINAFSISVLMQNWDRFDFFTIPCNIYYSLANYKFIPFASFEPNQRKEDYKSWANRWKDEFVGMDFALDFDVDMPEDKPLNIKLLNKARQDCVTACSYLSEKNIPFFVSFSGSKGFHVEIPIQYIKGIGSSVDEWVIAYQEFVKLLKKNLKLKTLDVTIMDAKRIFKAKYSVDVKSGLVCLPLTQDMLNNFAIDLVQPDNVLSLPNLGFRGNLLQNKNGILDYYGLFAKEAQ